MNLRFRNTVEKEDIKDVKNIVSSTGFFRNDEINIAVELVQEYLDKGEESGYKFIFAEIDGKTVAYSCYGLIPCSLISWDLYWIVTHNDFRGKGIGKIILQETENQIKKYGGKTIYIETSSKEKYFPTQKFYEKNRYSIKTIYEDFYELNDNKIIYYKKL